MTPDQALRWKFSRAAWRRGRVRVVKRHWFGFYDFTRSYRKPWKVAR